MACTLACKCLKWLYSHTTLALLAASKQADKEKEAAKKASTALMKAAVKAKDTAEKAAAAAKKKSVDAAAAVKKAVENAEVATKEKDAVTKEKEAVQKLAAESLEAAANQISVEQARADEGTRMHCIGQAEVLIKLHAQRLLSVSRPKTRWQSCIKHSRRFTKAISP